MEGCDQKDEVLESTREGRCPCILVDNLPMCTGHAEGFDRAIIATAAYLVASIHQSIVEHLQWMRGTHCSSLLTEAEKAVQGIGMDLSLEKEQVQTAGSKKLAKIAAQAQQKQLMDVLQAKTIHGVIMRPVGELPEIMGHQLAN